MALNFSRIAASSFDGGLSGRSIATRAKNVAAFMAATWSRGDLPSALAAGADFGAGAALPDAAPFAAGADSLYWSWIFAALARSALSSTAVRPKIQARFV